MAVLVSNGRDKETVYRRIRKKRRYQTGPCKDQEEPWVAFVSQADAEFIL